MTARTSSTKKTGGGVEFTRSELVVWKRASPDRQICSYCGINANQLYELFEEMKGLGPHVRALWDARLTSEL